MSDERSVVGNTPTGAEKSLVARALHFTPADAAQSAQDFTSINLRTREEKNQLAGFKFTSSSGPEIRRWLKHGIGVDYAGRLPKYRALVE